MDRFVRYLFSTASRLVPVQVSDCEPTMAVLGARYNHGGVQRTEEEQRSFWRCSEEVPGRQTPSIIVHLQQNQTSGWLKC